MRVFHPTELARDPRGWHLGYLGYEITVPFTGDTVIP